MTALQRRLTSIVRAAVSDDNIDDYDSDDSANEHSKVVCADQIVDEAGGVEAVVQQLLLILRPAADANSGGGGGDGDAALAEAAKILGRLAHYRRSFAEDLLRRCGAQTRCGLIRMLRSGNEKIKESAVLAITHLCPIFAEPLQREPDGAIIAEVAMQLLQTGSDEAQSDATGMISKMAEGSEQFATVLNAQYDKILRRELVRRLRVAATAIAAAAAAEAAAEAVEAIAEATTAAAATTNTDPTAGEDATTTTNTITAGTGSSEDEVEDEVVEDEEEDENEDDCTNAAEAIGNLAKCDGSSFASQLHGEHGTKVRHALLQLLEALREWEVAVTKAVFACHCLASQSSNFAKEFHQQHGVQLRQVLMRVLNEADSFDEEMLTAVALAVRHFSAKELEFAMALLREHPEVRNLLENLQEHEDEGVVESGAKALEALGEAEMEARNPMIKSAAKRARTEEDLAP